METLTQNTQATEFLSLRSPVENGFETLRSKGEAIFSKAGFPTTKNEEWKYTSLAPVFNFPYGFNTGNVDRKKLDRFAIAGDDVIQVVVMNGRFIPSLSSNSLPPGLTIGRLSDFSGDERVKKHLGSLAVMEEEALVALNTAFLAEGVFISSARDVDAGKTIHIINITDSSEGPVTSFPRALIIAGPGSRINIFESFHAEGGAHSFVNSVSEIVCGENSSVEVTKLESENEKSFHVDHTEVMINSGAAFLINTITTGGRIVRNNLHITLGGSNSNAHLNGLFTGYGDSHVDNHTRVDHAVPNCYSSELYKSVLDDKSRGVFNGKIFVRKNAQKTNAYQSNKNLLLTDDASMYAKPQLEIYADDVKCSHGATTGQLDDEALFYLRSRGIGIQAARTLLTSAFAAEIVAKISNPVLRDNIMELILSGLNRSNK